jgi:Flp pilus assembly protein TadD
MWGAGLLVLLLAGCAAAPERLAGTGPSPEELLEGGPLTGGAVAPDLPDVDVLALDDVMRAFIAARVPEKGPDGYRLRKLLEGLIHDDAIAVAYAEKTYTVAEAFHLRRANCLAYTNLFIALAREAGLRVRYQEVDVPPDWSRSGGLLVQNRHMNAVVDLGDQPEQIVDFNMADFRLSYDRRPISDQRARAHYHSNVGAERLEAGDRIEALQHFRKALALEPGFVPAWINLGTLYQRAGKPAWAEAAWRQALRAEPGEPVALSNLERLYRASGRPAEADELRARVDRHRQTNPYYRYRQAEQAFAAGDYAGAIRHLRFAIQRKANEDRFYALLGLAYLRSGDPAAARRFMARAAELAADESLRQAYHSKLELLRRDQERAAVRGS